MRRLLTLLAILVASTLIAGDDNSRSSDLASQKERLGKIQSLVGKWRGVAQPRRGSNKDSWIEESEWAWSFERGQASLVAALAQAKYFKSLKLSVGEEEGSYVLTAAPSNGKEEVVYLGRLDENDGLVLMAGEPPEGLPDRISIRFVADGSRQLLLLEKKAANAGRFVRLAEVGYTRRGSGFGKSVQQRECVVTGGLGSIEVMHEGQTYYVCCTGCLAYFNDNPADVLAEFFARKAQEKKAAETKAPKQ